MAAVDLLELRGFGLPAISSATRMEWLGAFVQIRAVIDLADVTPAE